MDNLVDRIRGLIRAGYSGIWIETPDVIESSFKIFSHLNADQPEDYKIDTSFWDAVDGWKDSPEPLPLSARSKTAPVIQFHSLQVRAKTVYVLIHFHRFLNAPDVVCRLLQYMRICEQCNSSCIILAPPGTRPPVEIEHRMYVMQSCLPDVDSLFERAKGVAINSQLEIPDEECLEAARAAVGLTSYEAESAFALSLLEHRKYVPTKILEVKSELVKASGFMQIYYDGPRFDALGGLDHVKQFAKNCLLKNDPLAKPRGILLLGVPGAGKSAFCKALGVEVGRPVVSANIGALYGSLVGQTEQNVRRMLSLVDSIQPCIFFIDEVEKALSGVQSSGRTDSGVSARVFGSLLTWLNDHETDVYTIVTCNDIEKLPPEFSRAERFDALFFFDLPSEVEREQIWKIYMKNYELEGDVEELVQLSDQWTGAEIKTCCRLARMLDRDIEDTMSLIVPVATTMSESLGRLRSWANGRCLDSFMPRVYDIKSKWQTKDRAGRRVSCSQE